MIAIVARKTGRRAARPRSPRVAVTQRRATRLRGEKRIVLPCIDWKTYLGIDKALGDDSRPGMRLNYLGGALEIMTTSSDHERIKSFIGDCIKHYCHENNIWVTSQGQMTRQVTEKCAAEADESYSFDLRTKKVGLVVEVCITSGGINKLALYEALGHPEVWFWKRGKLQPYIWEKSEYRPKPRSTVLPGIDMKCIEELSTWTDDFKAFREYKRRLANNRPKH
jgi:Uma2 family endonuclease